MAARAAQEAVLRDPRLQEMAAGMSDPRDIVRMMREQNIDLPYEGRPSSSNRAQFITAGLTLAPLLAITASSGLSSATVFFKQLFGEYGQATQRGAVEQLDKFAKGERVRSKGLIEAYQKLPDIMTPILERVNTDPRQKFPRDIEVNPISIDPGFMSGAELAEMGEAMESAILFQIRELIDSGITDKDELMAKIYYDYRNTPPEMIPDVGGIVDLAFIGSVSDSSFSAAPSSRSDATNTNPNAKTLNDYLESALKQKDLDKKADAVLGLKMGQKQQLESQIENSPDFLLAGIQSRRQALFRRSPAKLPSQINDEGLVIRPYYSRFVQQ